MIVCGKIYMQIFVSPLSTICGHIFSHDIFFLLLFSSSFVHWHRHTLTCTPLNEECASNKTKKKYIHSYSLCALSLSALFVGYTSAVVSRFFSDFQFIRVPVSKALKYVVHTYAHTQWSRSQWSLSELTGICAVWHMNPSDEHTAGTVSFSRNECVQWRSVTVSYEQNQFFLLKTSIFWTFTLQKEKKIIRFIRNWWNFAFSR